MSLNEIDILVNTITSKVMERLNKSDPDQQNIDSSCCSGSCECAGCGHCVTNKQDIIKSIINQGAERISAGVGISNPGNSVAQMIDHTLLKPDSTKQEIIQICEEAKKYSFKTVCVNSSNIRLASACLHGSSVLPIAVVGFPLGATTTNAKAYEAKEAVRAGAKEIDMVMNIGAMKSADYEMVLKDISAVVKSSSPYPVKVIIESATLTDEQKVIACSLSKIAGAAFVKTSTGFGPGGATEKDVALMRRVVGKDMGVKASGGIKDRNDFDRMVKAGANRVGASASIGIVKGEKNKNRKGY